MSVLLFAAAQGSTTTTTAVTTAKSVSVTSLFVQLFIALAVILGLIAVVAKLARGRVSTVRRSSAPLAVVGRQSLGKGVQVAIVRAGTEMFLLGVTQHQVTRICRFNPGQAPEALVSTDDLPPASSAAPTVSVAPTVKLQSMFRQIQDRTLRRN